MEKITIIGAGIGGLTTAIALQQKKIDFEIYEAFESFQKVGAGIMLANNAMQVMQHLDLSNEIQQKGQRFDGLNVTDDKLKILSRTSTTEFVEHKIEATAIHRGELHQILLGRIPNEKIHLGKRIVEVKTSEKEIVLTFKDGTSITTNCLIGADGIHSVVRESVRSNVKIRSANQNCWRGIATLKISAKYAHELNELWGKGKRFGFVAIGEDKWYWYALKDDRFETQMSKAEILQTFKSFHPLVQTIIEATPESEILNNPIYDLKPIRKWHQGRICLLGDAAHATTPNLGQGACQSIEDALALTNSLVSKDNIFEAFDDFQNKRIKKATKIVDLSWRIGKISHLRNTLLITLRNIVLRSAPKRMMKRQNVFLNKINE